MVCEYVFYEANPSRIDLQVGTNNAKQVSGGFTTQQLNSWGFISGQRIPARVASLDADIEDAMDEGIIFVGAAGNGRWRHCLPEDQDWDNTFEMSIRYPASVTNPYYYMRGTSPTANDNVVNGNFDLPNICVGSMDSIQIDQKVIYSDCGSGVDIWAPGTSIISPLPSGVADSRNSGYFLGKYSGTSMASPQVCGVLACALEIYPHWKQEDAKAYITGIAKLNQLRATSGGPADGQDLQGAPNLTLFYKKEREVSGNVFPKINYNVRPVSGSVYPRPRIRRTI
jgi:subtilisin family serine protease